MINLVWHSSVLDAVNTLPLAAARPAVGNGTVLLWLSGAVGALLVVGIAARFGYRAMQRHRHHSHPALFCGLCDAHQLDRDSRRLLTQVARFHRMAQPARLFTEPEWLDPGNVSGALLVQSEELIALRNRLFSLSVSKPR